MRWLRGKLKKFLFQFQEGSIQLQRRGEVLEITVTSGWDVNTIQVPHDTAVKLGSWFRRTYPTLNEAQRGKSTPTLSLLRAPRDPGGSPSDT